MNVIHFTGGVNLPRDPDATGTSGATRVVLELARAQAAVGHRVAIVMVGAESWRAVWQEVDLASIKPFPVGKFCRRGRAIDLRRQLALALFCARLRPDVVHGHTHSYMRFIPAPCRVVHFHSDPYYRGAPGVEWDLKGKDFAVLARYSDAQIGVSEFVAGEVRRGLAGQGNVHAIPNGIDAARFGDDAARDAGEAMRRELELPANAVAVLFAGAITTEKGFIHLAQAFTRLYARYPNAYLLVAGSTGLWGQGDIPEYRRRYESETRLVLESVMDRVRFLGSVSSAAMPAVYTACDIVTMPSIVKEGFPMVALESLASGRPLIGSRIGGLAESVDETCGRLVTPGDEDELLAALCELVENEDLRRSLGQVGRLVAARFTWESMAERIESVYTSVLLSKKARL